MEKTKKITICPKCHSSNYYISNNDGLITGHKGIYVCNECGFEGAIFPRVNLDKIPKLKKIGKLNVSKKIKLKENKPKKIKLIKFFIFLLFIFLTYTAYRIGLFDFVQSPHKHVLKFFSKYEHFR